MNINLKIAIAPLLFGAMTGQGQVFVDQADELGITQTVTTPDFGSGLSTYDFNGDNLDDITLCNSFGDVYFYRNNGSTFELLDLGVASPGEMKHFLWVDFNNDGNLDMFFTDIFGSIHLIRNNGNNTYTEITASAGLPTQEAFNTGASFHDYDLDGDLDLFVSKYVYSNFDSADSSQYNRLYRNDGSGTFEDVTVSAGILVPPTLSFQSVWFDFNGDVWPDLYVINDRDPRNHLYINDGDGTFTEKALEFDMGFAGHDVMSNSIADFDHDGDFDIYMTNTGAIPEGTNNKLCINNDGVGFTESASEYGIGIYDFSWGALWIDSDNDTWDDLLYVTPDDGPIYFFESQSADTFLMANDQVVVPNHRTSYCPAKGDFNNDGYPDIAIQCNTGNTPYVLMNQGGTNSFIAINLHGTLSNKQAIGSWIDVYANGVEQHVYTTCGENYHGQSSNKKIFGLGDGVGTVDSVIVRYPSMHIDRYYNLDANQMYQFHEGETYEISFTSSTGQFQFCEGDSILISGGVHSEYLWSNGSTQPTIWATNTETYSLTATSENGIVATNSIEIGAFPTPSISVSYEHILCHGDSTGTITLTNQTGVEADSVSWSNGQDGAFIDSLTQGEYSFEYWDINGCYTSGDALLVEAPASQFVINSVPETNDNADGVIFVGGFGGTPPFTYYLDDEPISFPLTNLVHGEYEILAVDGNGCEELLLIIVEQILSTQDYIEQRDLVYPNPAQDQLFYDFDNKPFAYSIYSSDGRLAISEKKGARKMIPLTSLEKGVYVIIIELGDQTYKQRFVKQ